MDEQAATGNDTGELGFRQPHEPGARERLRQRQPT